MNILFETLAGSKLYGTNSELSDTDIKGVFLPDINDLIMNRMPKVVNISTGNSNSKNTKDDVDKTYYSLQYFLELAAKGETNCLDLLFANSNKDAVLKITPVWEELLANKDKIITRNISSYLGFCKSQFIKYSVKGDKLNNFNKVKELTEKYMDDKVNGRHLLLSEALTKFLGKELTYPEPSKNYDLTKIKVDNLFGDHCYLLTAENKERYIQVSDVKFNINEILPAIYHKVFNIINSYGERAKKTAENNGIDYKAISHAIRVSLQAKELLLTHEIKFPLIDAEYIKDIKYGHYNNYDNLLSTLNNNIKNINMLLEKTDLRESADHKWIEKFILKQYGLN